MNSGGTLSIYNHEDFVQKKLDLMQSLLGNYQGATEFKAQYAKMLLHSNINLVRKRQINNKNDSKVSGGSSSLDRSN